MLIECSHCGEHLAHEQFALMKAGAHGRGRICKRCRVRENHWRHLDRAYGLTVEEYAHMLNDCQFKCESCGGDASRSKNNTLQVDHCHETGDVRGLLCQQCNGAAGSTGDSPEQLRQVANYLERYL